MERSDFRSIYPTILSDQERNDPRSTHVEPDASSFIHSVIPVPHSTIHPYQERSDLRSTQEREPARESLSKREREPVRESLAVRTYPWEPVCSWPCLSSWTWTRTPSWMNMAEQTRVCVLAMIVYLPNVKRNEYEIFPIAWGLTSDSR